MSSKDTLIHELSTSGTSAEPAVFLKKSQLTILDQNTSYHGSQSRINTSAISNSTYLDMKNAYLSVPICLTLTGKIDPATAATSLDYSVGLAPFNHNMIHNMSVSVNGAMVKSVCNFENVFHTFRLLSLLSMNETKTLAHIGFAPDDIDSFTWSAAASANGNGVARNRVVGAFDGGATVFNTYAKYNSGLVERMKTMNYRHEGVIGAAGETYASLLSNSQVGTLRRSRIFTNVNETGSNADGVKQYQIDCIIPLKTFSFFENLPLVKGTLYEFLINWNNCAFDFVVSSNTLACSNTNITHPLNGTNPVMVASAGTNEPNSVLVDATYRCSIAVGNKCLDTAQIAIAGVGLSKLSQQVELRVDSYALNPEYEATYISNPIKKVVFKDIQHFQLTDVAADGGSFTHLITSGTSNLCSLLVVPQFTASTNSTAALTPTLSPFDAGVYPSPLAAIGNYNVRVAGENLYNEDYKYDRDMYLSEINGSRSINSGLTQGLGSGQLNRLDWELCPYYYSTLSRGDSVSKGIPKSVQIQGSNLSSKRMDYHIFLEYERTMDIDVLTGQFMV